MILSNVIVTYLGFCFLVISSEAGSGPINTTRIHITEENGPNSYLDHFGFGLWELRWILTASNQTNRVRITFEHLNVGDSGSCSSNAFFKIYDGANTKGNPLTEICRLSSVSPVYVSGGDSLTLTYRNTEYVPSRGFKLFYSVFSGKTEPGWNTLIEATPTPKYILSPNYPNNYPNTFLCWWRITAPLGHVIRLESDDFLLHESNIDHQDKDHLAVYDGATKSDNNILQTFSGNETVDIISTGLDIYMEFISNGNFSNRGFRLQFHYTQGQMDGDNTLSHYSASVQSDTCVEGKIRLLTAFTSPGHITSPGYPNPYPRDTDCKWNINARDSGFSVLIEVLDCVLGEDCDQDSVTVYDDSEPNDENKIDSWCGNDTPNLQGKSRNMFIWFRATGEEQHRGFEIRYRQVRLSSTVSPDLATPILGSFFGVVLMIAVVVMVVACLFRKALLKWSRRGGRINPPTARWNAGRGDNGQPADPTSPPAENGSAVTFSDPPPAYDTLWSVTEFSNSETPPEYSTSVNGVHPSSDILPSYEEAIRTKEVTNSQ